MDGQLKVITKGDQSKDIFRDLIGYSLIAIGMLERAENILENDNERNKNAPA
jgi:hypothetical protein